MKPDDIHRLEDACAEALAELLRREWPHPVEGRICHLMAKAAVTVLEAVEATRPR